MSQYSFQKMKGYFYDYYFRVDLDLVVVGDDFIGRVDRRVAKIHTHLKPCKPVVFQGSGVSLSESFDVRVGTGLVLTYRPSYITLCLWDDLEYTIASVKRQRNGYVDDLAIDNGRKINFTCQCVPVEVEVRNEHSHYRVISYRNISVTQCRKVCDDTPSWLVYSVSKYYGLIDGPISSDGWISIFDISNKSKDYINDEVDVIRLFDLHIAEGRRFYITKNEVIDAVDSVWPYIAHRLFYLNNYYTSRVYRVAENLPSELIDIILRFLVFPTNQPKIEVSSAHIDYLNNRLYQ